MLLRQDVWYNQLADDPRDWWPNILIFRRRMAAQVFNRSVEATIAYNSGLPAHERYYEERIAVALGVLVYVCDDFRALSSSETCGFELLGLNMLYFLPEMCKLRATIGLDTSWPHTLGKTTDYGILR